MVDKFIAEKDHEELYKMMVKFNDEKQQESLLEDEAMLFFSFDIVNSSIYKEVNGYKWAYVIEHIISKLRETVQSAFLGKAEVWRILGDEVIFIVRLTDIEQIYSYVANVYTILQESIAGILNGNFFIALAGLDEIEIEAMRRQNVLSLKGAAWIARVSRGEIKTERFVENIYYEYDLGERRKIFEFLGNDIDAGFRIAKQTCNRRLVISFELAYLLAKRTECLELIHIITYKELKGIWGNSLYPIIWYYDKNEHNGKRFEDSFFYDEAEKEGLVKEYFLNMSEMKKNNKWNTNINVILHQIMEDRNLMYKIEGIEHCIKNVHKQAEKYIKNPLLELHCVAVCFKYTGDARTQILIAKRSNTRALYPSRWEFGCAKANENESIVDVICKEYKDDFGVELRVVLDTSRIDNTEPMPLAVYSVNKDGKMHKGIIFLAEITNDYTIEDYSKKNKYEDLRWITEDEVEDFDEEAVADFKDTLRKAFEQIKIIKKEK